MSTAVQIEQKSYEMPPREGIGIAHFLAVTDTQRSARYYEKVFGARILSLALFDQMTELYPHWVANQSWLMFGFPQP